MNVTVITPHLNHLRYLKRCCASVEDQGQSVEHWVVDGGSSDETVDWLRGRKDLQWVSEKDRGMYDAVNKGLRRARGELLAYLNADEQYLPGALAAVRAYFDAHPETDMVFGHVLLVAPDGSLVAFRKAYPARWPYVATDHLYNLSCGMFFRRRIVEKGILFDESLRYVGDADFVVRVLRAGYRADILSRYVAAFTMTGKNMSAGPNAQKEHVRLLTCAPALFRLLRHPLRICRRLEKALHGGYTEKFPLSYAVYTDASGTVRQTFTVEKASFRWPESVGG